MTYDNTERSPHPEKSEDIWLSVVVRASFDNGFIKPTADFETHLRDIALAARNVWRTLKRENREQEILSAMLRIQQAPTKDAIDQLATELATIPLTSAERKSLLEAHRTAKDKITLADAEARRTQQAPQHVQPQVSIMDSSAVPYPAQTQPRQPDLPDPNPRYTMDPEASH